MEKVEVDLLNKDDDNYNREVLHSVKVPMMMKIMFLKGVFFKSNTHASYIMLQGFYGEKKICYVHFHQDGIYLLKFNYKNICDYYHRFGHNPIITITNTFMNEIVTKSYFDKIICLCSLKCFCIVLPTNFSSRAAQKLVIYIKVRLHSHCHPHSHYHSHSSSSSTR